VPDYTVHLNLAFECFMVIIEQFLNFGYIRALACTTYRVDKL